MVLPIDLQDTRSQQWLTAGLQPAMSIDLSFQKITDLGWKASPPNYLGPDSWEIGSLTLHVVKI